VTEPSAHFLTPDETAGDCDGNRPVPAQKDSRRGGARRGRCGAAGLAGGAPTPTADGVVRLIADDRAQPAASRPVRPSATGPSCPPTTKGRQPSPRPHPRPRRTSDRDAQDREDLDQAAVLPTQSHRARAGRPHPASRSNRPVRSTRTAQCSMSRRGHRLRPTGTSLRHRAWAAGAPRAAVQRYVPVDVAREGECP
jgi:hypothetical protein